MDYELLPLIIPDDKILWIKADITGKNGSDIMSALKQLYGTEVRVMITPPDVKIEEIPEEHLRRLLKDNAELDGKERSPSK